MAVGQHLHFGFLSDAELWLSPALLLSQSGSLKATAGTI